MKPVTIFGLFFLAMFMWGTYTKTALLRNILGYVVTPSPQASLASAIENDSIEDIKKALAQGADVNKELPPDNAIFPLHRAVECGSLKALKYLIKAKADLEKRRNGVGWDKHYMFSTPLIYATSLNGTTDAVELLAKSGAQVNIPDACGIVPLYKVCAQGNAEQFTVLTTYGADPLLVKDKGGNSVALHLICGMGKKQYKGQFFRLSSFNPQNDKKREQLIKKLVGKYKININQQDTRGNTALHYLIERWPGANQSRGKIFDYLRTRGARIDLKNKKGETLLHLACKNSLLGIIEHLVLHGRLLNEQDKKGNTPLHLFNNLFDKQRLKVIKLFVEHGADIMMKNGKQTNAIFHFETNQELTAYTRMVKTFYAVKRNKQTFEAFAKKYLSDEQQLVESFNNVFGLLHRATADFVKKFLMLAAKRGFLYPLAVKKDPYQSDQSTNPSKPELDNDALRWFLLRLAKRPGSTILSECFPFLDAKKNYEHENLSLFDQAVDELLKSKRYSDNERGELEKKRNECLLQKKSLLMIPKKLPKIIIKDGGPHDNYAKSGFVDLKLKFPQNPLA